MLRLYKTREEILSALDSSMNSFENKILCMYNSRIKGFITDPTLMSVAIDDHMVHRGHSVFDTASVTNGKLYNHMRHIQRLFKSAEAARITHPFSVSEISEILIHLATFSKKTHLYIRYWLSVGPGSMTVFPVADQATFYAIATEYNLVSPLTSGEEFTVSIPYKPKLLANLKSTNYLLNALCCMESMEKGGQRGLQIDENGLILEGSVNNVCFIFEDKTIVTPPFDRILNGTTIERVFEFAQVLKEKGIVKGLEQREIKIDEAKTAIEMFNIGGDSIKPIVRWDGVEIGDGKIGEITQRLWEMLCEDYANPERTVDIVYEEGDSS